jgi:integrase
VTTIYTRNKNESGSWRYGRIKAGRGQRNDKLSPPFYVRPFVGGRQSWIRLNAATSNAAREEAARMDAEIETRAKVGSGANNRTRIADAVSTYLDQKKGREPKTIAQYRLTLDQFVESLGGKTHFMDEITEDVLRSHLRFMIAGGYAGKTIDTRLNITSFLLKKNGIALRVPRDEKPVVEEEPAVPYADAEIKKLFAAMDKEDSLRYKFFLGSGCRRREVTFAAWHDIDFDEKTYHVCSKLDVGFTPKSHESRTVPLPDSLIALLRVRHKNPPHSRWVFVNDHGSPENHFLEKLKFIALTNGLNCGQCRTTITIGTYHRKRKVEVSCKDHPVCERFILHRFRKTCATRWSEAGIPVRTLQNWLGHKKLETTMRYLGVADASKLRSNVNAAFGD